MAAQATKAFQISEILEKILKLKKQELEKKPGVFEELEKFWFFRALQIMFFFELFKVWFFRALEIFNFLNFPEFT